MGLQRRVSGSGVRLLPLVLFAVLVLVVTPGAAAARKGTPPKLAAKSWILVEQRSGEILASSRPDRRLPMASTTKLMTALIALERLPPDRVVTVGGYRSDPVESLMGLDPGQRVSVRDLLYGLILLSGNDAAVALARAVSGTVPRFVGLMNRTARRLGLESTRFGNPIGLDQPGHFSTAEDLALLARDLMEIPRFRRIADSREARLTSYRPPREILTTNDFLLAYPWANGVKTGATLGAGYNLVSAGRRRQVELVGVVLGTDSEEARDGESAALLEWGFGRYTVETPLRKGEIATEVPIRLRDDSLGLVPGSTLGVGVRRGQAIEVGYELPTEVEGPVRRGAGIGRATVVLDGRPAGSVALLAAEAVSAPTVVERVVGAVEENPLAIGGAVFAILLGVVVLSRRRKRRARETMRRIGKGRT